MAKKILLGIFLVPASLFLMSMDGLEPPSQTIWTVDARYNPLKPFSSYCNICRKDVHGGTINQFLDHLANVHQENNVEKLHMKEKIPHWQLKYQYTIRAE